jgi:histidyl-tRNA synthetase
MPHPSSTTCATTAATTLPRSPILLTQLGVPFKVDKQLVRGLDYYTRTAFEIQTGALGAQSAVAGGGRYDGLVESLGGPHIPAIGFAIGFDRLAEIVS